MSDVRAKIDVSAGLIELEGDREFVSAFLDKLLPLVEASGLGQGVKVTPKDDEVDHTDLAGSASDSGNQDPIKKKRKVGKPAPAGASCRDRITTLRAGGFFKEHRTPSEIVQELGKKGWTHNVNQVSAALGPMFSRGEIQRTKNESTNGFSYFWDRE